MGQVDASMDIEFVVLTYPKENTGLRVISFALLQPPIDNHRIIPSRCVWNLSQFLALRAHGMVAESVAFRIYRYSQISATSVKFRRLLIKQIRERSATDAR
jgi:hypothetical protein